jgi:hypothetical protein
MRAKIVEQKVKIKAYDKFIALCPRKPFFDKIGEGLSSISKKQHYDRLNFCVTDGYYYALWVQFLYAL